MCTDGQKLILKRWLVCIMILRCVISKAGPEGRELVKGPKGSGNG